MDAKASLPNVEADEAFAVICMTMMEKKQFDEDILNISSLYLHKFLSFS